MQQQLACCFENTANTWVVWGSIKADLDGTTFAYNCLIQLAYNSCEQVVAV